MQFRSTRSAANCSAKNEVNACVRCVAPAGLYVVQVRRAHYCCTVAAVMVGVHIVSLPSRNCWFIPSLSGKILVIPRADRSFTNRNRTSQEYLHATPLVQFVERFQVHPCPDCEHLAGELKCDSLGALLVWPWNKSLDSATLFTWGRHIAYMSCNLCKDAVDVVHVVLCEFPTAEIDHVTSTWSSKVFLPFV